MNGILNKFWNFNFLKTRGTGYSRYFRRVKGWQWNLRAGGFQCTETQFVHCKRGICGIYQRSRGSELPSVFAKLGPTSSGLSWVYPNSSLSFHFLLCCDNFSGLLLYVREKKLTQFYCLLDLAKLIKNPAAFKIRAVVCFQQIPVLAQQTWHNSLTLNFCWDQCDHPLYSPNLAYSYFHLFLHP